MAVGSYFKKKIGSWQIPASSKIWELEKRIKKDKKTPGVCLELSKQDMMFDMVCLMKDGVILYENLEDFS